MKQMQIRLNKFLASLGIASRRKSDTLILAGKVKVNGKVVKELGIKVDEEKDKVEVDQQVLEAQEEKVYFMLNKPLGYITSNTPTALEEKIVVDLLPKSPRIFPIGRLDKATSGLLLLTNDGNLSFRLTHPSFGCEKEYEAEVDTPLTKERVRKIEAGVRLEGRATQPAKVKVLAERKARVILKEGKNRQVRKIFGKVGCEVVRLKRVRVKNLELGDLKIGEWRKLTPEEVRSLYA